MEDHDYGNWCVDRVACYCNVPTLATFYEVGSMVLEHVCLGNIGVVFLDGNLPVDTLLCHVYRGSPRFVAVSQPV